MLQARLRSLFCLGWRVMRGLLLVGLVSACSPKYDWRTVHDDAGRYAIEFPAKPNTAARDVPLGEPFGLLRMTMQSARSDETFAIGYIDLPGANDTSSAEAEQFGREQLALLKARLQAALLQNLNNATATAPQMVVIKEADGKKRSGEMWQAQSTDKRVVRAYFADKQGRVYQVVVIGAAQTGDAGNMHFDDAHFDEVASQFLNSFVLD